MVLIFTWVPHYPIEESSLQHTKHIGGVAIDILNLCCSQGYRSGYPYKNPVVSQRKPRNRSDVEIPATNVNSSAVSVEGGWLSLLDEWTFCSFCFISCVAPFKLIILSFYRKKGRQLIGILLICHLL